MQRKTPFADIKKTYPRRDKFEAIKSQLTESKKRKRPELFIEERAAIEQHKEFELNAYRLFAIETKDDVHFEHCADHHMDIAEGRKKSTRYKNHELTSEQIISRCRQANSHYHTAIRFLQEKNEPVSLDLYFSCLNAMELITRIESPVKAKYFALLDRFIENNNLAQKIEDAPIGEDKKEHYRFLLNAYNEIGMAYKLAISSKSMDSTSTPPTKKRRVDAAFDVKEGTASTSIFNSSSVMYPTPTRLPLPEIEPFPMELIQSRSHKSN